MERMYICNECGYEIEIDGIENEIMLEKNLCESCFDELYTVCELCGEIHLREDVKTITDRDNGGNLIVCEGCIENNFDVIWCDYHEEYEYCKYAYIINNYGSICGDAMDYGDFGYCENCEEYFCTDDLRYDEDEDRIYCDECYEDIVGNRVIKGYHNHKCEYECNIRRTTEDKNKNVLTFGFELEVENNNYYCDNEDVASEINDNTNLFNFEYDGSLDDGFEIISNPFTTSFMKSEGKEQIKTMLDILNRNDYKSHDTNTCGLHFHISKEELGRTKDYKDVRNNILLITEYFKEEMIILSRRTEEKLNRWAKFYKDTKDKNEMTIGNIIDSYQLHYNDRYHTINTTNRATLEFRCFRGTLKYETLMATWELVANICEYAMENEIKTNEQLYNLDFMEIITYKHNEYIEVYATDRLTRKNVVLA